MSFKEYECALPLWALSYLVNGDKSALTEEEVKQCDEWTESWGGIITIDVGDEPYFSSSPEFGPAAEVYDCKVWVQQK